MAFLGWLPFALAVVGLPSVGDLAFFVSSVALSPSFPINAIIFVVAAVLIGISASVLVAAGEASLLRAINRLRGIEPVRRSLDDEAARLWVIQLAGAIPAVAAAIALAGAVAGAAPAEYQAPDLGGGPFIVRLARDVWPLIAIELVAVVAGQAFAAGAQRASIGRGRPSLAEAVRAGVRGLLLHPLRRLTIALTTDLALSVWLVLNWALLQVLWAPIGRQAGAGGLLTPGGALLLVGFVAIWLCLVAGGGALHAWSSTWWSLEVDAPEGERRREDVGE